MYDTNPESSIVESVRALKPELRERAAEVDKTRGVGADMISKIRKTGVFKVMQPKKYGGYALPPKIGTDAIFEASAACGSTGWTMAVLALHQWEVAHLPQDGQDEIWGETPEALCSSAYAPSGSVTPTKGGFILNGKWGFSSGCDHADWTILGGIRPPRNEREQPTLCGFFVSAKDRKIIDDWHVLGLRGTASKSIVLEDVFVPEHRHHAIFHAMPIKKELDPTFNVNFSVLFSEYLAACALGMAQGVLDQYIERSRSRIGADRSKLADNPDVHRYIAEVEYVINAGRALMVKNQIDSLEKVANGIELETKDNARKVWEVAKSVHLASEAAYKLYMGSGAHSIFEGDPIQRAMRDLQAGTTHRAFDLNAFARNYGGMNMGRPNQVDAI
jgi:3-hydroxy-9,10-secoandrosta-1,3,5(10)-triene-9,17-dione monooxygenase